MGVSLVTGGEGFIGSHLVEALLARGERVRTLDDLSSACRSPQDVGVDREFIRGSVASPRDAERACEGVDTVYHLAAMSRAAPSDAEAGRCINANVIGTATMLEAAARAGVKAFVYAGSSTIYGSTRCPHSESGPVEPRTYYAWSKASGEELCQLYARRGWVQTSIVRYFSVYGPRQPRTGAYALALGIFLEQWRNKQPFTIHGNGCQRRDFVHVNDVVSGTILASMRTGDHRAFVYNLGSGRSTSILELVNLIDPSHPRVFLPPRQGDAWETQADIFAARTLLGWEPYVSLAKGIEALK
jgi:UDP-glucose 4-epimerase